MRRFNEGFGQSQTAAAIVIAACVVVFASGCGGKSTSTTGSAADKAALAKALNRVGEIKTGRLKISAVSSGKGNIEIAGNGPFDVSNAGRPKYAVKMSITASGTRHTLSFARVASKRYLGIDGAFVDLASRGERSGSGADALDPGQLKHYARAFAGHLSNVRRTGNRSVDGGDTVVYTATIDLAAAVRTAERLSGSPAAALPLAGLEQLGDPDKIRGKATALTLAVGTDGLIREGELKTQITAINGQRPLTIRLSISGLNESVKVALPAGAGRRSSTPDLLGKAE